MTPANSFRGFWFRSGFWQRTILTLCVALAILATYATWLNVEIADLRDRIGAIERQSQSFHDRQPEENFAPASMQAEK